MNGPGQITLLFRVRTGVQDFGPKLVGLVRVRFLNHGLDEPRTNFSDHDPRTEPITDWSMVSFQTWPLISLAPPRLHQFENPWARETSLL